MGADPADQAGFVSVLFIAHLGQAGQNTVPRAQRRIRRAGKDKNNRFGLLAVPLQRAGKKVTIRRGTRNPKHRDGRQFIWIAIGFPLFCKGAVIFHRPQNTLQLHPVRSLDPEGFRNVALRCLGRVIGNPTEDVGL